MEGQTNRLHTVARKLLNCLLLITQLVNKIKQFCVMNVWSLENYSFNLIIHLIYLASRILFSYAKINFFNKKFHRRKKIARK